MLGDVLVNGVVGEPGQRVATSSTWTSVSSAPWIRQTKNRIDDAAKLALVEKLRGSRARPR